MRQTLIFFTVQVGEQSYSPQTNYGYVSTNGVDWEKTQSINVLLSAGVSKTLRCYLDIPVDVEDLTQSFTIVVSLPNSSGGTTDFAYHVTEEDRVALAEQEISLDKALASFTKEEGQTYFKNHLDDFEIVTGDEIQSVVTSKKWHILVKYSYGSGEFNYVFEDSGKIKETALSLSNTPTGYLNDLSWSISGDTLMITSPDKEAVYEMRKIEDGAYLLLLEGEPYMLLD